MRTVPTWFRICFVVTSTMLLVVTAAILPGLYFLKFDDDLDKLFRGESADFVRYQELLTDFGSSNQQCVILLQAEDVLAPDSLKQIRQLDFALAKEESIDRRSVFSLCTLYQPKRVSRLFINVVPFRLDAPPEDWSRAREQLDDHPLGDGFFYNSDRTCAIVTFEFASKYSRAEMDQHLSSIEELITSTWTGPQRSFGLTGLPVIRHEVTSSLQRDQAKFTVLGLIFATLVGGLLFRKPVPILIVATVPFTGLGWTMGILGWVGMPLNIVNNVVTPLVLVIGFAECVHVLFVAGGMIGRGLPLWFAVTQTIRRLFVPCLLAAITTMIGFGSLAFSADVALREFAFVAAAASALMFVIVTLGTAVLLASPLGKFCARSPLPVRNEKPNDGRESRLGWPALGLSAVAILLTITAGIVSTRNGPDYRFTENLPDSNRAALTMKVLDREFGGSLPIHVLLRFQESPSLDELVDVLNETHRVLQNTASTSPVYSFLNLLESMPGEENGVGGQFREVRRLPKEFRDQFVLVRPPQLNLRANLPDLGSAKIRPILQEIEVGLQQIESDHPRLKTDVTGLNVLSVYRSQQMIGDLVYSLFGASIIIFALIVLIYRRVEYAIAAIIVNAFPLVGVAALMAINGHPIQYTSIMLLCTCLGLAVDDTVHFLAKLQVNRRHSMNYQTAVLRTARELWPILSTTTAMLAVGFGLAATSDIPTFQSFGGYACVGLALALVGDLLFLPAILLTLHRLFPSK